MIPIILIFLLPSTISQYPSLADATPLRALATAVDSTYPPVDPNRQYWGTFYYPWYEDGELPPLEFAKKPATPLQLGHTEPEVIRVNQTFYLYHRTDSSIAVANSTNGLDCKDHRTVLTPSPSGWDSAEVISPSIILDNGTYYLFYEADDTSNPGNRAVGLATSTSPTGPFTKHPNNPILTPSQTWEGTIVGTPAITRIGTTYYLFYHGFSDGKDRGGVAYSNNLLTWTKEANNPILNTGPASSWDSEKVAPSDVYSSATNLWLFYEGYNGTSWRIGLATATPDPTDGRVKSLTKQPAPILDLGPPGSFDSHTVQLPTVVLVGRELWLYYSGNDGLAFHFGRATAPTPDTYRHWHESKPNNQYHNPPSSWASMYLPDDGTSGFDPALQLYSSKSTDTIKRHLTWMDRAELDFALVSWWGPPTGSRDGGFSDSAFSMMLSQASLNNSLKTKLAVYLEEEGFSDLNETQIVGNLTYIYDKYASSSAYFKVSDGTRDYPVVFVYGNSSVDTIGYTDRWSRVRDQMYADDKPLFIALKVWEIGQECSIDCWWNHRTKVDSWHQYGPAEPYERQRDYSAYVSPGFLPYPETATSRASSFPRNPTLFARNVTWLARQNVTFRLVQTFNEWHEGTQVEPGIPVDHRLESGFAPNGSSYGFTYIDIIRYRGQPADFSISTDPASLNITQGSSGTSSIVLKSLNGFEGVVNLDATVSPTGPTVTLTPASIELRAGGQGTAILEITSPSSGVFTLTIIGTSGSLSQSLVLEVTITSPPPSETPPIPPDSRTFALVAGLLVIVAITVVLFLRRKRFRVSSQPSTSGP